MSSLKKIDKHNGKVKKTNELVSLSTKENS